MPLHSCLQIGIHELGVRKAIRSVVKERLHFETKAKEKEKDIAKEKEKDIAKEPEVRLRSEGF